MHRLLTLYPPPSDPDAFRAHFEGTHLPLVEKLPGLRDYNYGFDLTAVDGGESPYFCTFAGDFDDARSARRSARLTRGPGRRRRRPQLRDRRSRPAPLRRPRRGIRSRVAAKRRALPRNGCARASKRALRHGLRLELRPNSKRRSKSEGSDATCRHRFSGRSRRGLGLGTPGGRDGDECCARRNADGGQRSWDVTDVGHGR